MKKILFLISFFISANIFAQKPYIDWSKTYGGQADDRLKDLIQLEDGSLVAVGFAVSSDGDVQQNQGGKDIWVVKMDATGELLWERTFGGSADEEANAVTVTEDGGLWIVGWTLSTDGSMDARYGVNDVFFLKLSSDGTLQRAITTGGNQTEDFKDIIKLTNNRYIIVGYSASDNFEDATNAGKNDIWAIMVNDTCGIVWLKNYGGSGNDICNAAVFDSEKEEIILVGSTASTDGDVSIKDGGKDFWVLRLNMEGELLQETTFGGSSADVATDVCLAEDGGLVIIGESLSRDGQVTDNQGNGDIWVIRLDTQHQLVWEQTLGSENFETAYHILPTNDGNFLSIGATFSASIDNTFNDLFLHQLDGETGEVIWEIVAGGSEDDFALSAVQNSEGHFILAGYTDSKDGDVIGDGLKQKHGAHDAWILQLHNTLTTTRELISEPLVNISPTYTNNFIQISSNTKYNFPLKFNIYTAMGQLLFSKKAKCFSTDCATNIDLSELDNGVYLIEVCNGVGCTTQKIVKVD